MHKRSHKSSRRYSSSKASKPHAPPSSSSIQPQPEPTWPVSFLFIVNELHTNDDPEIAGSIQQRRINGRWHPPELIAGFFAQQPGHVYRWNDGIVSLAPAYTWTPQPQGSPQNVYSNGTIFATEANGSTLWPEYYRAATVFYCNHFDKFFTTRGDVTTRDIASSDPEDGWHPLSFFHENHVSCVDHAGDQEFLAVRTASWIEELLPNTYRRHSGHEPAQGGLAGILPIVIALVAFSCVVEDFYTILIDDRAWRRDRWVPHRRQNGRIQKRGMIVTVFRDPENPQGSTLDALQTFEDGPIFR